MGRHLVWTENAWHTTHILLQSHSGVLRAAPAPLWRQPLDSIYSHALHLCRQACGPLSLPLGRKPLKTMYFLSWKDPAIGKAKVESHHPIPFPWKFCIYEHLGEKNVATEWKNLGLWIQLITCQPSLVFKLWSLPATLVACLTVMVLNKTRSNLTRGSLSCRYLYSATLLIGKSLRFLEWVLTCKF